MKLLLYICGAVSLVRGIYELVWIRRGSELAVVLMLLAFIVMILCFSVAKKWKVTHEFFVVLAFLGAILRAVLVLIMLGDLFARFGNGSTGRIPKQMQYKIMWPDNKKFAVCLTHDVDRVKKTYQYITHSRKGGFLEIWQLLTSKNPHWNFKTIMGDRITWFL